MSSEKINELTFENFSYRAAHFLENDDVLSNFKIEIGEIKHLNDFKSYILIKFPQGNYDKNTKDVLLSRISLIFEKLKLSSELVEPNFPFALRYKISPMEIDGKINWRMFIPYPEKLSQKVINLLDEVVKFPEISTYMNEAKGDSISKFSALIKIAFRLGLITEDEKNEIENGIHLASF